MVRAIATGSMAGLVAIVLVARAVCPAVALGQAPTPVAGVSAVTPIAAYHGRLV